MKALSQLLGNREQVEKMVKAKWNVEMKGKLPDGTKYGGNDDDVIFNPILGWITPKELKEAELYGAVVYQYGAWRITALTSMRMTEDKSTTVMVNPRYLEWRSKSHPRVKQAVSMFGAVNINFDMNQL